MKFFRNGLFAIYYTARYRLGIFPAIFCTSKSVNFIIENIVAFLSRSTKKDKNLNMAYLYLSKQMIKGFDKYKVVFFQIQALN